MFIINNKIILINLVIYPPSQWRPSLKHHGKDECSINQTHCNTKIHTKSHFEQKPFRETTELHKGEGRGGSEHA